MTKATFFGSITEGRLVITNRKRFAADCSQFKDGPVEIIIRKRNRRSVPQNAWYWGILIEEIRIRLNELGNAVDADMVHEFLKGRFNQVPVIDKEGTVLIEVPGSTTELNKGEFSDYCERIVQWAAEFLEITIPAPNEQTSINY